MAWVVVDGVDRNDMGVLQPGHRDLGLLPLGLRDLQGRPAELPKIDLLSRRTPGRKRLVPSSVTQLKTTDLIDRVEAT